MKGRVTVAILLVLILWIGASIILIRIVRAMPTIRPAPPSHLKTFITTTQAPKHLIYPYSVIPGGIHSFDELGRAHDNGFLPVGFDINKAHFTTLDHDVMTHVTFRNSDGSVYWSKRAILIRAGERIVTDGHFTLLLRCGNEIAVIVPGDVPTQDAPVDADIPMEQPVASVPGDPLPPDTILPSDPAPIPVVGTPLPSPPGITPGIPIYACCAGLPPTSPIPPVQPIPPRVSVPDGDHGVVWFAGLIMAAALYARRRKTGA
jgi:hypothetical protein